MSQNQQKHANKRAYAAKGERNNIHDITQYQPLSPPPPPPPPPSAGRQPSVSNFRRGKIRKNRVPGGVLKSPCHRCLPGGLLCFLSKKYCKMQLWGSIFKCQSWLVLVKQPINVYFCNISVLLNHLNNITRN